MFRQHEVSPLLHRRLNLCITVALLAFSFLIVRLWALQVLQGEAMRALSEDNRIRIRHTQATRGSIVDRQGRVLVDSRAAFDAVLVPEDSPDLEVTVELLSHFLNQSAAQTKALLDGAAGHAPFHEIVVKRDLNWDEVVALETHQLDLPGVDMRVTPLRHYPQGPVLAHVLGYVGETTREDIERDRRYRAGDLVGKAGLEKSWEEYLRGVNGGQQVEVDALGRELRVLDEVPETPGNTLVLTIDLDLQLAAENALGGRPGAVVALDPRSGDTLAIVSQPAFDPNVFSHGIRSAEWKALVEDPYHPLTNRAIQGQYPPGSTFKIVVATAALEEGVINPFTGIHCGGGLQFGNHFFHCWKKGGHGTVQVHEALVQSCDVFFYQVGQRLGIDVIAEYARAFGLGSPTGTGLEHEKGGVIPDSAWKRHRFNEPWYAGETLSAAIGQGYITATPMQMAELVATMGVGVRYRPRFVSRVETPGGDVVRTFEAEEVGRLPARKITLDLVRAGLVDVVNTDRGTGKNARLPNVTVAGKTGTSQSVRFVGKPKKGENIPWEQRDHAWFVAYAPAENPAIAVAVLVEHAGAGGGAVAAPVANQVLQAFFDLEAERGPARYAKN
jgi:penicillin-binding protein 2